jgi:transcriptional antiterminator Rof (Rho-off)
MTNNELLLSISNMMDEKLDASLKLMENDIKSINNAIESLEKKVTSIELTLENETNHGIKIIAEGHLDLSRKLDEALKVENEKEMLLLRVNHLENELRKVKERINQIA